MSESNDANSANSRETPVNVEDVMAQIRARIAERHPSPDTQGPDANESAAAASDPSGSDAGSTPHADVVPPVQQGETLYDFLYQAQQHADAIYVTPSIVSHRARWISRIFEGVRRAFNNEHIPGVVLGVGIDTPVVPAVEIEEFGEALLLLRKHSDLRAKLGRQGQSYVREHYRWGNILTGYARFLRKILENS